MALICIMKTFFAILLSVCVLWSPTAAMAQDESRGHDPFTLYDYTVHIVPGNPDVRREQALEYAEKHGLDELLQKLTPRQYWDRHEQVKERLELDNVLEKFSIISEEYSPKYVASMNITFNRDMIEKALTDLGIPYSLARGGQVLMLPLLDLSPRQMLWEEDNPWRTALMSASDVSDTLSFKLPAGDMEEMSMLTPEMAAYGAGDVILNIGKNYGTNYATVCRAGIRQNQLTVNCDWYGETAARPVDITLPIVEFGGFEEALQAAAKTAVKRLNENWRETTLVRADKPGRLFIRFSPSKAGDIEQLTTILKDIPIVKEVVLKMFSRYDSLLQVDVFGGVGPLNAQLAQKRLVIEPMGKVWVLRQIRAQEAANQNQPQVEAP